MIVLCFHDKMAELSCHNRDIDCTLTKAKMLTSGPLQKCLPAPALKSYRPDCVTLDTFLSLSKSRFSHLDSGDNDGIPSYRVLVWNKWDNPYKPACSRSSVNTSCCFRPLKGTCLYSFLSFFCHSSLKNLIKPEHSLALMEALPFERTLVLTFF